MSLIPVAIAKGDGIGPEIMEGVLKILNSAGAPLKFHEIEIGEKCYSRGFNTGIEPESWNILRKCRAFLKAPITTPQGGGFKSLNVTIRSTLGLYANVRPCVAYAPFIKTKHPEMDVVIIRENEEDLYSGIEYCQTPDVCSATKLISRQGCEKIIHYAFEYAKRHNRKKVTCFTKDNIMKLSDGLFHKVFDEIAKEYPEIESEHWIVDIGAAKLADTPEAFDVIVVPNLYGDILSDVAAQISGSIGLAGSANIGEFGAMFEAIHGSAPRRAGQNIANPSGLLFGAIQMLIYLGCSKIAEKIHNSWLATIESGIHTYDIYKEGKSQKKVSTKEFAESVCHNLGKMPQSFTPVTYDNLPAIHPHRAKQSRNARRDLIGIDCYFFDAHSSAPLIVEKLKKVQIPNLELSLITNRGARIYPDGAKETSCIEQWRVRFKVKGDETSLVPNDILVAQSKMYEEGFDLIKTENLYAIDGNASYSSPEW